MKLNKNLTAAVIGLGAIATSNAASIMIADGSLEAAFSGTQGTAESGWFTFGQSTGAVQVDGGFWNIANADGTNAAYTTSSSTSDGGSIYQSVTLDAGRTYRLTASIAQSASVQKNNANYTLVFFDNGFSSVLAETTGVVANQSGAFVDDSVEFTVATTGTYHIGVRNRGHIASTGADNNQSTVFFDNVRLEDTTVPEPSSTSLLGLAGLALILRRRK